MKVNIAALDPSAREAAAKVLDEHVRDVLELIKAGDLKPSEELAARTSATQAQLMALELRGSQDGDMSTMREQVRSLMRQLESANTELDRLRRKHGA